MMRSTATHLVAIVTTALLISAARAGDPVEQQPAKTMPIAQAYQDIAKRITRAVVEDSQACAKLQQLCDETPHRLAGSPGLDKAIRWAANAMKADGHEHVRIEPVMVSHWERGRESLTMVEPHKIDLPMLGLGGSVGTPPEGITAKVVVVADEKELDSLGNWAVGKIVLFNCPMHKYDPVRGSGYGRAVKFRTHGARFAAGAGAVACLVRSATATSLRSPHTGMMSYGDAEVKIPSAAITIEDADMFDRLAKRGIEPTVTLRMEAKNHPPAPSGNVIGEIRGSTHPEQIVVISGHIDAWDVGQGAHDDGTGCVMAMEALTTIRRLGLTPKRTIRVVLFTNEENGLDGGKQYAKDHAGALVHHVAAIEADGGCFAPRGFSVQCDNDKTRTTAVAQLRDIAPLLEDLGAGDIVTGWSGADIGPMRDAGVVLMGHRVDGSTYFDYHHSLADTFDKINPELLNKNVAAMAIMAYVLADMPERLGKAG